MSSDQEVFADEVLAGDLNKEEEEEEEEIKGEGSEAWALLWLTAHVHACRQSIGCDDVFLCKWIRIEIRITSNCSRRGKLVAAAIAVDDLRASASDRNHVPSYRWRCSYISSVSHLYRHSNGICFSWIM
uniref:Uncharacterized protein n=1 Tax=Salix viminalis TaxID=40686 RepID=A0A6N2KST9_SALVM